MICNILSTSGQRENFRFSKVQFGKTYSKARGDKSDNTPSFKMDLENEFNKMNRDLNVAKCFLIVAGVCLGLRIVLKAFNM